MVQTDFEKWTVFLLFNVKKISCKQDTKWKNTFCTQKYFEMNLGDGRNKLSPDCNCNVLVSLTKTNPKDEYV